MDEKKYEAGRVEISSAEYRDLVTEATENKIAASEARSDKWRVESERDKLKAELEKAQAEVANLRSKLDFFTSQYSQGVASTSERASTSDARPLTITY